MPLIIDVSYKHLLVHTSVGLKTVSVYLGKDLFRVGCLVSKVQILSEIGSVLCYVSYNLRTSAQLSEDVAISTT